MSKDHEIIDEIADKLAVNLRAYLSEAKDQHGLPVEDYIFIGSMASSVVLAGFVMGGAAFMGIDPATTRDELFERIVRACQLPYLEAYKHKLQ